MSRRLTLLVLAVTAPIASTPITGASLASAAPARRVLSLRAAERAIDLAWQAELAGDYGGGRDALELLSRTATSSMETPARARLEEWLAGANTREVAFREHGRTPRGFLAALSTLERFGAAREDALWSRAINELPELAALAASACTIAPAVEELRGKVERSAVERTFAAAIERGGCRVARDARFLARIDVDATEAELSSRSAKVTAVVSIVLESGEAAEKSKTGTSSKRRTERRRGESEARAFAVRRALDDAGESVIHLCRRALLGTLASR